MHDIRVWVESKYYPHMNVPEWPLSIAGKIMVVGGGDKGVRNSFPEVLGFKRQLE